MIDDLNTQWMLKASYIITPIDVPTLAMCTRFLLGLRVSLGIHRGTIVLYVNNILLYKVPFLISDTPNVLITV